MFVYRIVRYSKHPAIGPAPARTFGHAAPTDDVISPATFAYAVALSGDGADVDYGSAGRPGTHPAAHVGAASADAHPTSGLSALSTSATVPHHIHPSAWTRTQAHPSAWRTPTWCSSDGISAVSGPNLHLRTTKESFVKLFFLISKK